MSNRPEQILTGLASTITQSILSTLGKSSIESIFLAGGAATGRIAWYEADTRVEIYSDLDLYVVVTPGTDIASARIGARSVIPSLQLETEEYAIFRAPDIGVFDRESLLSQPHRPGTVEIPLAYRMLYGDEEAARQTSRFEASRIGRDEALYLLENRMLESVDLRFRYGDDPAAGVRRWIYYTSLKQCLDVVSAVLIADGVFVCDPDERMALFRERSEATGIVLDRQILETIDYAHEHMGQLQRSLQRDSDRFDTVRLRSERALLTAWKNITASLFRKAPSVGWERLLALRSRDGSIGANLREAVILSRSRGRGTVPGLRLWTAHPHVRVRRALRLAGVCELIQRVTGSEENGEAPARFLDYLDSLTGVLGVPEGNICRRAATLYQAVS